MPITISTSCRIGAVESPVFGTSGAGLMVNLVSMLPSSKLI